jgi:acetolactate synthase I/II/III large subunit
VETVVTYTVGDLTAVFLSACGVTTVFGIVSVHNIPILDGIGRRNAIRFVTCRGEMGGGHMADAYARASGGLGVLITSTGPGAANAVSALVEARIAGSPVLHITAQTDTRHIDRDMGTVHNVPRQSTVMAAVCKASFRIRTPAEALGVLCRAAAEALSAPVGPVTVEIPADVQRATLERPAALDRLVLPLRTPQVPAAADLEAATALLRTARRPLLWLGSGARHAGKPALDLLDMGFGCVTSWSGRGTVAEDHPRTLGALDGNGSPDVEAFYGAVDAMVVVGSRLRGFETLDFTPKLLKRIIHIDTDPLAQGRPMRPRSSCVATRHWLWRGSQAGFTGRYESIPNSALTSPALGKKPPAPTARRSAPMRILPNACVPSCRATRSGCATERWRRVRGDTG